MLMFRENLLSAISLRQVAKVWFVFLVIAFMSTLGFPDSNLVQMKHRFLLLASSQTDLLLSILFFAFFFLIIAAFWA
jgi:hypothetical protein